MCTRVYICRIFVCLSRVSVVFAFFLLARLYGYMAIWLYGYMPLALLSTLNCAAVCFSLYMYVQSARNPHFPTPAHHPRIVGKKEKRVDVSKWHQKYLRFIMTTDISLFDICVAAGADGGLTSPPQSAFHVIRFN